jgi:hypothetical protein
MAFALVLRYQNHCLIHYLILINFKILKFPTYLNLQYHDLNNTFHLFHCLNSYLLFDHLNIQYDLLRNYKSYIEFAKHNRQNSNRFQYSFYYNHKTQSKQLDNC